MNFTAPVSVPEFLKPTAAGAIVHAHSLLLTLLTLFTDAVASCGFCNALPYSYSKQSCSEIRMSSSDKRRAYVFSTSSHAIGNFPVLGT